MKTLKDLPWDIRKVISDWWFSRLKRDHAINSSDDPDEVFSCEAEADLKEHQMVELLLGKLR